MCIVGAVRTPIGAFQGSLASLTATQLGSVAITGGHAGYAASTLVPAVDLLHGCSSACLCCLRTGALDRAGVAAEDVQEVYMGIVLSANLGQVVHP